MDLKEFAKAAATYQHLSQMIARGHKARMNTVKTLTKGVERTRLENAIRKATDKADSHLMQNYFGKAGR
ncbi:MAG: hypothetical protein NTX81_07200 [Candidatus Bathyarchaeota archaeon]|nr:hypothetical protein [Candidatus Bathyarchaeota archaeon]